MPNILSDIFFLNWPVCVCTTQTQPVTDRGNVICNDTASPNRQSQQECMMLISLLTQHRWGTGKCFETRKQVSPGTFYIIYKSKTPTVVFLKHLYFSTLLPLPCLVNQSILGYNVRNTWFHPEAWDYEKTLPRLYWPLYLHQAESRVRVISHKLLNF